jgi:hypothetical protein
MSLFLLILLGCQTQSATTDPTTTTETYGSTTTTSTTTTTETVTVPTAPPPPQLFINEAMTRNDSTVMEPTVFTTDTTGTETLPKSSELAGPFADWIELYNPNEEAIDLSRLSLTDGGDTWQGTEGEIAPNDYLVLWADGLDTGLHLPFRLSQAGEEVELSVDGVLVDTFTIPEIEADTAWGRFPDAGTETAMTIWPTPGWTNGSGPGIGTEAADAIFQTDVVNDLWLWIPESGMNSLGNDPYEEVTASLAYGAVFFPAVGVRIKGVYGSLRSLDQKTAFKIDIDAFEDRAIRGLTSLSINNMVQDSTYTHEHLTYRFFRDQGLVAPRTGYTRLYVNDEYFGLYLWLESVEKQFLKRWYEDASGVLVEGAYGTDFYQGWEGYFEYDEGPDPQDWSDITELAAQLAVPPQAPNAYNDLKELVDMEQFLRVQAAEALLLHWDGYTTANNYRVYHDPITDKFEMIPWGTDQTWVDVWYGPYDGYGLIYTWCEDNPACFADYQTALGEVADNLEALPLRDELDDVAEWLRPLIVDDPRKEFDMSTHDYYLDSTRTQMQAAPNRIRGYL